jgi:PadR family transcriptional regulator PadR
MSDRSELLPGTLDLIILKTLETLGPLHGYGITRRIRQVSEDLIFLNQGTLYPALLRLEQKGWIRSAWGQTETGREARFYRLTAAGRRQIAKEVTKWDRTAAMMMRVLQGTEGAR